MPRRRVEIYRGPGIATHVDVSDTANLQHILAQVAKACGVRQDCVRLSVNGQHVKRPTEVPPAGELVAAVRTEEQNAVTRPTEEVSIPPKPVIMHQDMEGFNVVVALDEVIDNSIRANATLISLQLLDDGGGVITGLVCTDDGAGMPRELAINHMRLAHTDSGIVTAPRVDNMPLAAALYFSKELSRHGKGAAALLYFGNKVETVTKTVEAAETTTVNLNYKQWLDEFRDHGTCTYKAKVTDWYDFVSEDEHYTRITIQDLGKGMAEKLANPAERQAWAQQVADHYYFFLKGFPEELWATLPADLLQDLAHARPAGGLLIDMFGIKLGLQQALPQQMPRPRLSTLLEKFLQLSAEFREADGQLRLMPFWLPIRWVESGMVPEEVPSNIRVDRDDRSGPAGKLRGVHRDFLLMLLYFPYKDGERTKPELLGDSGAEDVLFTAWCGRMIPKAFSLGLPPLVAEAKQSQDPGASAYMLTQSRLCGVLFCSPEIYTSNHKTELMDEAFDAVLKRLGAPHTRQGSSSNLWVRDTHDHKWCESPAATQLLVQHHKKYWAPLEQQGELRETEVLPDGEVIGRAFRPPGSNTKIKARELVRLLTPQERQSAAEASQEAGSSKGRRGGGQPSKSGAGSSAGSTWPYSYRLVQHFSQHLGDGPRFKVQLQEWEPEWLEAGWSQPKLEVVPVALISPVPLARQKELLRTWNESAPRYLAWWDVSKSQKDAAAYRDVSQLPGISSLELLSAAQVPESMAVCFVDSKCRIVDFKRDQKWASNIFLGADCVSVQWLLHKGELRPSGQPQFPTRSIGGVTQVKYTMVNKAPIERLRGLVEQQPGPYKLKVESKCHWVTEPLEYVFTVADNQAHTLDASWRANSIQSGGNVPCVKLGQQLPELEIRAKDSSGKSVPFLFRTAADVQQAITVTIKSPDGKWSLAFSGQQFVLSTDRQMITVTNWRLNPQKLRLVGNAPMQGYIGVQLEVLDGQTLQLAERGAPMLQALSGPPTQLKAERADFEHTRDHPYRSTDFSRGSRVLKMELLLLDQAGNKLDLGQEEEYCARVRFDPPDAAEFVKSSGGSRASEAGPSSAARRRKSGSTTAGTAAHSMWRIHVDGNVVEIVDDYKWRVPPGAGPAGIIVDVFRGKVPPLTADAQPLLTHEAWFVMQRIMHVFVDHHTIGEGTQDGMQPKHADRWSIWKSREGFSCREEPVPFVLNTSGFWDSAIKGKARHVPLDQNAGVPEELLSRFCEGFEPRQDVAAGQLVMTFVSPSGNLICSQASADRAFVKGKVPYFLANHWNRLLEKPVVYRAAFLVAADPDQELAGVRLTLTNEEDEHDEDFCGHAKLCLRAPDGSLTSVYSSAISATLDVAAGQLALPPIRIQPEWFTADSKGMATLVLLDDEPGPTGDPAAAGSSSAQQWQWDSPPQKELGSFHLRLAPAAEQLLVMAVGAPFEGITVELPPQPSSGRSKVVPDGQTRFTLKQQARNPAAAGSSQRQAAAAPQGAWAPWCCVPVREASVGSQQRVRPEVVERYIHPRDMKISGRLHLQLGQPVTVHFVAVDFMGCPAVLSKQQKRDFVERGLQLQSENGGTAPIINASQTRWNWAAKPNSTSSAQAAGVASQGHLGGPFVNSCTFTVMRGCGRAKFTLTHTGSFGRQTLLQVPVLLEAGPLAVDGVRLQNVQAQPHGAPASALFSCNLVCYVSPVSLQPLEVPADAAAEEVQIKQEPGLELGMQQQQQQQGIGRGSARRQQLQDERLLGGDKEDPIELLSSDEEDDAGGAGTADMQANQLPDQPQLSAKEQWLRSLGPSQAALLYELERPGQEGNWDGEAPRLVEGATVRLQLQLFDSAAHEIAAECDGKLRLQHLRNWGQVQEQQAQPEWQDFGSNPDVNLSRGSAEVLLQLGVGNEWVGEQVFQVLPCAPVGQELASALPVLLRFQVARGPFADGIRQVAAVADPAGVAVGMPSSATCQVTFAEALAVLCGGSEEEEQQQQALKQLPVMLERQQPLEELAGVECTILQISSSSSQGPAAVLPYLSLELTSRDGSTLALQALQPLRVQLQAWAAQQAADGSRLGAWVPVQPQQQQQRFGQRTSGPGLVSVQAVLWDPAQQADGDQQQQQPVFELPLACRQLPHVAGLYRVCALYDSDLVTRTETLRLPLGPFLLLAGAPHRLQPFAQPQPEPNPGRPLSGNKRGRGKGAAPAAAGGSSAAPPVDELVMENLLASTTSPQHVLQLVDSWDNGWRPAAAKLASRLQAAGAAGTTAGAGGNVGSDRGHRYDADDENTDIYGSWTREQREQLMRLAGLQGSAQQDEPAQPPGKRQRTMHHAGAAADAHAEAGTSGAAATVAAAGDGGVGPAAEEKWVLQLLLRKVGAPSTAAGSSRQAAAAAGGLDESELRHISTLDFDPSGYCTVSESTLFELGIESKGDWELYGQAVPASAPGSGSSNFELDSDAGRRLKLLLGSWHVVSEDSRALKEREVTISRKLRQYNDRVKAADAKFGKHEAASEGAAGRLRQAEAVLINYRKDLRERQSNLAQQRPLVQLQEQVTAAAGQRGLLGQDDRRQRMLEHPWMTSRQTNRQQTLRSRRCSAQEVQAVLPNAMLHLHQENASVLGPLVTLGAVECHDVAVVLSSLLQSDLSQLICTSESAKQPVKAALGPRQDLTPLELRELIRFYYCPLPANQPLKPDQAWYQQHPQRLLPPTLHVRKLLDGILDWHCYDPDQGFVGIGSNLVYLNQQLSSIAVNVKGRPDRYGQVLEFAPNDQLQHDLRKTLWHWKLGNVLVFEREEHVERFRERAKQANRLLNRVRLVALDGYTFGVKVGSTNFHLRLNEGTTCFGPAELVANSHPLDLRLRCIKDRERLKDEAQRKCSEQESAVQKLKQEVEQYREQAAAAKREFDEAAAEKQQHGPELAAELRQVQEELFTREKLTQR